MSTCSLTPESQSISLCLLREHIPFSGKESWFLASQNYSDSWPLVKAHGQSLGVTVCFPPVSVLRGGPDQDTALASGALGIMTSSAEEAGVFWGRMPCVLGTSVVKEVALGAQQSPVS